VGYFVAPMSDMPGAERAITLAVFATVYLGMLLGRLPHLALDRTGIALLGAIALLATGVSSLERAAEAVDAPTMLLLFGLMVVSAQLRLGGFYARTARGLAALSVRPVLLLALLIAVVGVLSAVFSNDIICLAMTPVWIDACVQRRVDPRPFLLALACAANVGSAATLIGNPQNMLIGQTLALPFAGYLAQAALPTALGLVVTWVVIAWQWRNRWAVPAPPFVAHARDPIPVYDRWQTAKGLAMAAMLLALFVASDVPRELAALAGAGVLLLSRRMHSREMLGLVDWQLLVLFAGLFVVNDALQHTGLPADAVTSLRARGLDPEHPGWIFAAVVLLSNAVSNVPAVMLLLPVASHPLSGPVLALAGTFAGNLLVVGSIANMIVIDGAGRCGVRIDWRAHARTGVPVTLLTLAIAALWLAVLPASG
jgi:Na+/H+ antiporter NhaD/arsenite permease-like protein